MTIAHWSHFREIVEIRSKPYTCTWIFTRNCNKAKKLPFMKFTQASVIADDTTVLEGIIDLLVLRSDKRLLSAYMFVSCPSKTVFRYGFSLVIKSVRVFILGIISLVGVMSPLFEDARYNSLVTCVLKHNAFC